MIVMMVDVGGVAFGDVDGVVINHTDTSSY